MASQYKSLENFTDTQREQKRKETDNWCEICLISRIERFHHKLPKEQKGKGDYKNMAGLCNSCHAWAHSMLEKGHENFFELVQIGGPFWVGARLMFFLPKEKEFKKIREGNKEENSTLMFEYSQATTNIIKELRNVTTFQEEIDKKRREMEQVEIQKKEEPNKPISEYSREELAKLPKKEVLNRAAEEWVQILMMDIKARELKKVVTKK